MADITQLILDDHTWFRTRFVELDDLRDASPPDVDALERLWAPLATHLDLHASAEESFFYPQLLRRGADDPEAETLDAIGDHNDIRDGVADSRRHPTGTAGWWDAVGRARLANDDHMAEEEREGISDFRRHAPVGLRESLGQQFRQFFDRHPTLEGVDISDKDPAGYVRRIEQELDLSGPRTGSLGIGSLKGR